MNVINRDGRRRRQNLRALLEERSYGAYASARYKGGVRRRAGGIAEEALKKLVEDEVVSGLHALFGGRGGMPGRDMTGRDMPGSFDDGSSPPSPRRDSGVLQGQRHNGAFDRRQLEISIDQMVASSLVHGRQTSGVLRALFGLVPSLIGR